MEGFNDWARVQLGCNGPEFSFYVTTMGDQLMVWALDHGYKTSVTSAAERVTDFLCSHTEDLRHKTDTAIENAYCLGTDGVWSTLVMSDGKLFDIVRGSEERRETISDAIKSVNDLTRRKSA